MNRIGQIATAAALIIALLLSGVSTPAGAANPSGANCAATATSGSVAVTIRSGSHSREFRIYLPRSYTGRKAVPLVFDLHGSGGSGESQARNSGFEKVAQKHGFAVAWPDGGIVLPGAPDQHYWNINGLPLTGNRPVPADAPDDVQFFADAIDQLRSQHCIDAARVYVAGHSGGARMASALACQLSDRIAAVAPVVGLRAGRPLDSDPSRPDPASCKPTRAVPVVTFHGTDDHTNPYAGGGSVYWQYGVEAAVSRWVALDGCRTTPVVTKLATHVERRRYVGCRDGAVVEFDRIDAPQAQGGGHSWPGSAPRGAPPGASSDIPSLEINATERIWEFFSQFRL
jgi:polyhydroxybutyrate depolymerase